jgi:hypothetical protein
VHAHAHANAQIKNDEHKWAFGVKVFRENFFIYRRAKESQSSA